MPRVLSPQMARAVLARETEEVMLVALTITHPSLTTIRIVNNTEAVIRSAGTHQPYPFAAILPDDTDSAVQQAQLQIDNIDREVMRQIRGLGGVIPKCTLEVILASSPNTVEVGPFNFSILSIDFDVMSLTASLGFEEDVLNRRVPAQTYNPSNSPGVFP